MNIRHDQNSRRKCVHSKYFSSSENGRNKRTFLDNKQQNPGCFNHGIHPSIYTSICLSIHLSDTLRCILCVRFQSLRRRLGGFGTPPNVCLSVYIVQCTYTHSQTHKQPKNKSKLSAPDALQLCAHEKQRERGSVSKFYTNTSV